MVEFFVPGLPATKGSWKSFTNKRTGKTNFIPDSPKYGSWTGEVKSFALKAGVQPMDGPVSITCIFFLPRPLAHYGKSKGIAVLKTNAPKHPAKKPDIDKMERCIFDALTGIAWTDDCQVVRSAAEKLYGQPGCKIEIQSMEVQS